MPCQLQLLVQDDHVVLYTSVAGSITKLKMTFTAVAAEAVWGVIRSF